MYATYLSVNYSQRLISFSNRYIMENVLPIQSHSICDSICTSLSRLDIIIQDTAFLCKLGNKVRILP